MGNRACVVFTNTDESEISPVVYLHWNGGAESIYIYLDEMERRKCGRVDYAAARFAHVVADHFDAEAAGSSSLGVFNGPRSINAEALSSYANMADDNGVFVVYLEGKTRSVRRFMLDGEVCRELRPKEVTKEQREAYKHEYRVGTKEDGDNIPKQFVKMRPVISQYG